MQTNQLTEMIAIYYIKGDLKNVRKLTKKIVAIDKARIKELKKIELNDENYQRVMSELNELEQIYIKG